MAFSVFFSDISAGQEENQLEDADDSAEITLVEAIRLKYCQGPEEYYDPDTLPVFKHIKETSASSKPGAVPIEKQTNLILDRKNISESGSPDDLSIMCPNIIDLHMPQNSIKDWENVFAILHSMPSLKILNLSFNQQLSNATSLPSLPSPHLSLNNLHLSCTRVKIDSLMTAISSLPNVKELHLSSNAYNDSDLSTLTDQPTHDGLSLLYLVENDLSDWKSVEVISDLFPNLVSLSLNSNPLREINPAGGEGEKFKKLRTLNLNECQIEDWESIDNLRVYTNMRNLSVLRTPVGQQYNEKERRFEVIGRLPSIEYLNKSIINEEERTDAQRWMLRTYKYNPNKPFAYQSLQREHGMLDSLAVVNLKPKNNVEVEIMYNGIDRPTEWKVINVCQSVKQFRAKIGKEILIPPSKLRLIYTDREDGEPLFGSNELRGDSMALFTFKVKDGDLIEVIVKTN